MNSPDTKKRGLPTPSSNTKKPKTPTFQSNVIELQSLLHVMENGEATGASEQALALRIELCQNLWSQVSAQLQQVDPEKWTSLQQQVQRTCQGGPQVAPVHPTIQRIFLEPASVPTTTPALGIEAMDDDEEEEEEFEQVLPQSAQKYNKPSTINVQDMQKQQQEQIQEAVSQMASKLKQETARIHSTLQQQTGKLDEMEDLVTENVSNVTHLAKDVQEHVSKGWSKTIGTWTMLFTVVGAFLFCMVTISMVPKREGACLFFCNKAEDQFCRVLPGGRKDCIRPVEPSPQVELSAGKQVVETNEKERNVGDECIVGLDGECIATATSAGAEKFEKALDANQQQEQQRKARSTLNVFAEEAAIDEIDLNVPLYNGRPFSGKDVRKAAAGGDLQVLSAMLEIKPEYIDAHDSNGWAALHLASRAGHEEIVRYLLKQGSNAELETNNGRTALDIAYGKHGAEHPVSKLLEQVSDTHLHTKNNEEAEVKQQAKAFTGDDIRNAAQYGNLPQLMEILLSAPDLIDAQDSNGWGPLHLATRSGHTQVVQYLIEAGCKTQLKTRGGASALSIAVEVLGSDHDIVHLLAARPDAEPMIRGRPFTEEEVRVVSQQGNLEILREMGAVKREWLEAQDENGWAAIHQAARGGHSHIVQYLLEQDCNPNLPTKSGSTALNIAKSLHGEDNPVVFILMSAEQS